MKKVLILIMLIVSIACLKNPLTIKKLTEISNHFIKQIYQTSCYEATSFLLSQITNTRTNEIKQKLDLMKSETKTFEELQLSIEKKIERKEDNIIYTLFITHNNQNHYFVTEIIQDTVYIYQAFQNAYDLVTSNILKKLKLSNFLGYLKNLLNNNEVVNSIKELFCYDENISDNIFQIFSHELKKCNYIIA